MIPKFYSTTKFCDSSFHLVGKNEVGPLPRPYGPRNNYFGKSVNIPFQYKNNEYNLFGKPRKSKKIGKYSKKRQNLRQNLRQKRIFERSKRKRSRSFGPNNVGYKSPMKTLYAGANTINYLTNKPYYKPLPKITRVQTSGGKTWLNFGKHAYTPSTNGSGHKSFYQPVKKLTSNFGGKTITLDSNGKINIT